MPADSFRRALVPDLNAALAARRALDAFGSQLEEDVFERGALVVTEVVSNSVKHAGLTVAQRIDLNITVLPACLLIEVTDDGAGFDPVVTRPEPSLRSGGWGLWMVEQLTDRWGVDFSHSTRVWCEFDLGPHLVPSSSRHEFARAP